MPTINSFDTSVGNFGTVGGGLQFLPTNVSGIPTTLFNQNDLSGNPLQTLVANIGGEQGIFDANSKVKIGTFQTVTGEGGGTYSNVPVLGGRDAPVIFENPGTFTLGLQALGGGAVTKAKGAVILAREVAEIGVEMLIEAVTGYNIPLINPKSSVQSRKLGGVADDAPIRGANNIAGQITGPGQRLAGQIDTIANMRPFVNRLSDATANPSRWKVVRSISEASTSIRNRGGRSLQEILRNSETGETIIRHTLLKPDGSIFDPAHFREFLK